MTQALTDQTSDVPHRVMLSQLLWTAGHSLTSGSFLAFFLLALMKHSYSAIAMSLLFAIPDIMGISGTLANFVERIFGSRKHAWIYMTLLSRGVFILLPLIFLIPRHTYTGRSLVVSSTLHVYLMLTLVACAWFFQNIAYVNLVTWITQLYPKQQWYTLFGKWEFARVGILILIPCMAAFLKYVGNHLEDYGLVNINEFMFYGLIFLFGCSLQVLSLAPLLKYPATIIKPMREDPQESHFRSIMSILSDRSICLTILGSWWLAFFQGLTQSVFFTHASRTLEFTLEMYVILNSMLYVCQTLLCFPSILLMNRIGTRNLYAFSMILVSMSLVCWFYSTKSTWWLIIGAYLIWGLFAPVNIAGTTLICKLSHQQNQALAFALFRTASGVFAGLAGIYGGYLLESAWKTQALPGYDLVQLEHLGITPFQTIILISFIGRITAPLWLFWVEEPKLHMNPK